MEKKLRVVNVVALEAYLRGVVPREMPKHWPLEALKAQAVAARSYALVRLLKGKPFDLYSDWRSQVYGGIAAEAPRATEAVQATAGQVVLYQGKVATTFFFSSSGRPDGDGSGGDGGRRAPISCRSTITGTSALLTTSGPHASSPPPRSRRRYGLPSPPVDVTTEITAS